MIKKIVFYVSLLILILTGLYFIFTTSPSVRYWVDDFCSATFLRTNGFWGAQVGWWKSWTGRYSAVFFTDIFESVGPWAVKILPILLLISLTLTFKPIFKKKIIFALFFVILTLINAPNLIQSFYWQTGSLNYTIPFVFLGIFLSGLVSNNNKSLLLLFLVMFVAGGFNETFAIASTVLLMFILLGIYILDPKDKKEKVRLVFAGLAGIVISLTVMSLAPGNAGRAQAVTAPESMLFVFKSTLLGTKWYLLRMLTVKTFIYSLLAIFASTFMFYRETKLDFKKGISILIITCVATIAVTSSVIFSGFYSMSILPPERALFVATFMLLIFAYVTSLLITGIVNKYLSKKYGNVALWLAVLISLLTNILLMRSTLSHWKSIKSEVSAYAVSWDKEVGNLPEIHNIKAVGELDSFTDNKGWVVGCLSGYYAPMHVKIIE